jgi:L-rhamnose mutarotase
MQAEYEESHRLIWPEMAAMLKDHGAHNYCISLHAETRMLFAYVEIEDEKRWDDVAKTDVCQASELCRETLCTCYSYSRLCSGGGSG